MSLVSHEVIFVVQTEEDDRDSGTESDDENNQLENLADGEYNKYILHLTLR